MLSDTEFPVQVMTIVLHFTVKSRGPAEKRKGTDGSGQRKDT